MTPSLPSGELVYVQDLRQDDVPDDDKRDQTQADDDAGEPVAGPDRCADDERRDQADGEPGRRILHVAEHGATVACRSLAEQVQHVIVTTLTHGDHSVGARA